MNPSAILLWIRSSRSLGTNGEEEEEEQEVPAASDNPPSSSRSQIQRLQSRKRERVM